MLPFYATLFYAALSLMLVVFWAKKKKKCRGIGWKNTIGMFFPELARKWSDNRILWTTPNPKNKEILVYRTASFFFLRCWCFTSFSEQNLLTYFIRTIFNYIKLMWKNLLKKCFEIYISFIVARLHVEFFFFWFRHDFYQIDPIPLFLSFCGFI